MDQPIFSRVIDPRKATKPLIVCVHGGGCNSRYFDLPGFSFSERANDRGYPLLLVDRPGYGGSAPMPAGDLHSIAEVIAAHVRKVVEARQFPAHWFMVGQSIGAAIATIVAAGAENLGLSGIALSGIGDKPTLPALAAARELETAPRRMSLLNDLLFGMQGSFSWKAPIALRCAVEDWQAAEVSEILHRWPDQFPTLARRVRVPVHLRLADQECIWETGSSAVDRLAASFGHADCVDAGLMPSGGHLFEVHHRGHELMASQLDFFDKLSNRMATNSLGMALAS